MRPKCTSKNCSKLVKPNGYKKDGTRKYCKYCSYCLKIKYNDSYKSSKEQIKKVNDTARLTRYGLTKESYTELINKQSNKCAICEKEFKTTPHIDHCHTTSKVRGLLCHACNVGIGLLGDTKEALEKALKYLS